MTTSGDAERKIRTVMVRSRGYLSSKNKPVTGIDRGVLFKSEVGNVIFNRPVGFKIPGEFKGISIFVQFACGSFSLLNPRRSCRRDSFS
jgi:hypothetical protein